MKKIVLLAVAGIFATQALYAPNFQGKTGSPEAAASIPEAKGNGIITRVTQDGWAKAPVAFATLGPVHKATGKTVNGSTTDKQGKFNVTGVDYRRYKLSIIFIGYGTKTIDLSEIVAYLFPALSGESSKR